jgi:hypothetical protein
MHKLLYSIADWQLLTRVQTTLLVTVPNGSRHSTVRAHQMNLEITPLVESFGGVFGAAKRCHARVEIPRDMHHRRLTASDFLAVFLADGPVA